MQLTTKDVVASALVVASAALYAAYVAFDGIPLVQDAKGMAAVGFVLGFASRRIGGRKGFAHERFAFAGALASMGLGVAALVTASETVLAMFIASMVCLWAAAMLSVALRARVGSRQVAH